MGANTLSTKSDGNIISSDDVNQYKTALNGDVVPRNSSGVATTAGGSLGSSTYKWDDLHMSGDATIDGNLTAATYGNTTNMTNFEPLGTVKASILTVAQFQAIMGTNWVLMDGSSCNPSDLYTLTSIATLPNLVNGGTMVQTDSAGNLGTVTTGDNKAHTHSYSGFQVGSPATANDGTYAGGFSGTTGSSGGTDNLAAGVKLNLFIKINN